jgi:hypothetical protein
MLAERLAAVMRPTLGTPVILRGPYATHAPSRPAARRSGARGPGAMRRGADPAGPLQRPLFAPPEAVVL